MFPFIWLKESYTSFLYMVAKQNFAGVSVFFSVRRITKTHATQNKDHLDLLSSLIPFPSNLQSELGNNLSIELTGFSTFPGLLMVGCSAIYISALKENHLKTQLPATMHSRMISFLLKRNVSYKRNTPPC